MRQVGIVAGPGLQSLQNVSRLEEDHENARRLADGLDSIPGLSVSDPETNIVLVDTSGTGMTAETFLEECAAVDVLGTAFAEHVVRFCTHLDVDQSDVATAVDRIDSALTQAS